MNDRRFAWAKGNFLHFSRIRDAHRWTWMPVSAGHGGRYGPIRLSFSFLLTNNWDVWWFCQLGSRFLLTCCGSGRNVADMILFPGVYFRFMPKPVAKFVCATSASRTSVSHPGKSNGRIMCGQLFLAASQLRQAGRVETPYINSVGPYMNNTAGICPWFREQGKRPGGCRGGKTISRNHLQALGLIDLLPVHKEISRLRYII
jgi:hypothetical protein